MSRSSYIIAFLYSLLILVACDYSWNETMVEFEDCNSTVPSGSNNPQPAIVYYIFNDNYTTIELNVSTGARCLDGTPYKFYFSRGQGEGINKWIFYFQGASFCGGDGVELLESCYNRISTEYGTSNSSYWGENNTNITSYGAFGWFSSMEEYNPFFYSYNKVELISCDGSNFISSIEEPLYYNGTALYFRGMNNTLSTFEWLNEVYGLYDADEIIIGGGSSGSTAAWIWSSYLREFFSEDIDMFLISDAGLFVDSYSQYNHCYLYRFFMQVQTSALRMGSTPTLAIFKNCKYSNSNNTLWKCMMPEYIYESINMPVFVINSQNDFKQLTSLSSLDCINQGGLTYCNETDREIITQVREKFLNVTLQMKKDKPHWGFWLRTCFEHTYHFTWAWYGHEMDVFSAELLRAANARDALYEWYNNKQRYPNKAPSYIDLLDWLHNPLCRYGANQYDEGDETPLPNGYVQSDVLYGNGNY